MLFGILSRCDSVGEICDGLCNRSDKFLSDNRTFELTFKEVLLIDTTTIQLFSDLLKGVGRNVKDDRRKK